MLPKLYFSPYSEDTITMLGMFPEEVGFICSVSQVNPGTGYTGFTPQSLRDYVGPNICLAQDHLGKSESDEQVFKMLDAITQANYNYVHLHTTNIDLVYECMKRYDIHFELGTGEDTIEEDYVTFMQRLLNRVSRYKDKIAYLSFPTGCKINGVYNRNNVDENLCQSMLQFGLPLKGHNSDYSTVSTLSRLNRYLDALNVAPQLGVLMTRCYLNFARISGINLGWWERAIIEGCRWQRWGPIEHAIELGGQYHFNELPDAYTKLAYNYVRDNVHMLLKHYQKGFIL